MSACALFSAKYPNAAPLPEVLGSSQGTGLIVKPTATERKREQRNNLRKIKKAQEEHFEEGSRDVDAFFESRQSLEGWKKHRAGMYLEDIREEESETLGITYWKRFRPEGVAEVRGKSSFK